MPELDIPSLRLHNQRLAGASFENPVEVVRGLVAVQSQDYAGAKWAVAQRTRGAADTDLDLLFNQGRIIRTHVLRPTWHFVAPEDICWLLALTAPRVKARNLPQWRGLELDDAVFKHSNAVLGKALQGSKQLTRSELAVELQHAGIHAADTLRLSHIMMQAELDAVICSGALRGKQHTYALLEERAPQAKALERDEALGELARRYFISRGPATVQDFAWWSGLAAADAWSGLAMIKSQLAQVIIDRRTFWFSPGLLLEKEQTPTVFLLPNYDEYVSSYKDRRDVVHPHYQMKTAGRDRLPFSHMIFINGLLVGSWQRAFKNGAAVISAEYLTPLSFAEEQGITAAMQRYGEFLGKPVMRAK